MALAALPHVAAIDNSASTATFAVRREWGDGEDAALVAAIAGGDAMALDQLYLRYRPLAFATAVSLLRDPSAAEDVVHDAFLSVWRAAGSFQPTRGPLRAWLMTIVRNAAIDHLRSRRIAPATATERSSAAKSKPITRKTSTPRWSPRRTPAACGRPCRRCRRPSATPSSWPSSPG